MKGIIFVELLSMAESLIGEDATDEILEQTTLDSGGVYTRVGNYPCRELMALVGAFSKHTGKPSAVLQNLFGRWIFDKFSESYSGFFEGKTDAFSMLAAIEDEVHVEVRKLYPEAELPSFTTRRLGLDRLEMVYSSERPLVDFCEGMIEACLDHFGQTASIKRTSLEMNEGFGARFDIQLEAKAAA